jgi:NodT family efflux transporter outer membrane factor (OMF) lipoprotein
MNTDKSFMGSGRLRSHGTNLTRGLSAFIRVDPCSSVFQRFTLALGTVAALAGCAVGPNYEKPEIAQPQKYKEFGDWLVANPNDAAPKGEWWKVFRDPVLDELMRLVEVDNQNLRAAEARYRAARAQVAAARAGLFPTIGLTGGANRAKSSGDVNASATRYTVALEAQWEIDLWGRVRRQIEAGSAGAEASAADLENLRLSIQAELATSYFQLRVTDTAMDVLQQLIVAFRRSLDIAHNRYNAGVAAKVDVVQAEAQVRSMEAQLIDTRASRAQLENAIGLLAGRPASSFSLAKLPQYDPHMPDVPPGLPSTLTQRRPDIAAAERRVAQANAEVGVAQAAYFPSLSLTGSTGFASSSLSNLFSVSNRVWSLGLGLAETLLDFGARGAQVDITRAQYDESVANYRQAVLTALQEVETNLAAVHWLTEEVKVQEDATRLARESVQLTLNQYKAGIVSYVNVVQVQSTQLSEERSRLQLLGRRLAAEVALIKALGGDWSPAT